MSADDRMLSYLPLAHVVERMLGGGRENPLTQPPVTG
jgi:long-subunit acyl-CoA synthetase (AMP-forming)